MAFSLKNFYHSAPAKVQRICAAVKAFGGAVGTAPAFLVIIQGAEMEKSTIKLVACVMLLGWLAAALAEGLEKLCPPPTPPDPATDPTPPIHSPVV